MAQLDEERGLMAVDAAEPPIRQGTPQQWRPEHDYSREQIELIKNSYVQGSLTDAEFLVFMQTARRRGLDPLEGQITAVKRWNARLDRDVMQIQTTIDGSRLIAQNTGELAGIARPVWGPVDNGIPEWAEATVYRGKPGEPAAAFTAVVWWDEFRQVDKKGELTRFWNQMPRHMLYKVALSHALRSAFQKALSGIYTDDEMAQADNPVPALPAARIVDERKPTSNAPQHSPGAARGAQGERSATQIQLNRIAKACQVLGRPVPEIHGYDHAATVIAALEQDYREQRDREQQASSAGATTVDEDTAFTFDVEEQQAATPVPDLADLPMARGGVH